MFQVQLEVHVQLVRIMPFINIAWQSKFSSFHILVFTDTLYLVSCIKSVLFSNCNQFTTVMFIAQAFAQLITQDNKNIFRLKHFSYMRPLLFKMSTSQDKSISQGMYSKYPIHCIILAISILVQSSVSMLFIPYVQCRS